MSLRSMKFRWARWMAVAAGLLAAYAAVGFWLVPLVIKDQIPKLAQAELARQAIRRRGPLQSLHLAPCRGRLAPGRGRWRTAASIGKLAVELQWRSLVRRAWSFADIRITRAECAPDDRAGRRIQSRRTAGQAQSSRPREASAETGLPRLIVERFALEQGKMDVRDQRAGAVSLFAPIDFALTDFSTLPDHKRRSRIERAPGERRQLRWQGQASVNPVRGSGELTLENVSMPNWRSTSSPIPAQRWRRAALSRIALQLFLCRRQIRRRLCGRRAVAARFGVRT